MATEKALRAAAKELNEVCSLNPPIDIKAKKADLEKEIKEILEDPELVTPADEFTDETQAVIDEFVTPEDVTPEEDGEDIEETDDDDLPEEDEEVDEDDYEENQAENAKKLHEKNIAAAPINKGKVVKEDAPEEKAPKAKAEKAPKVKAEKAPALTKKSIIIDMTGSARGATIEEMAQAMVDKGVDADYKKNCVVTKLWLAKMGFNTRKDAIQKDPRFKR